MHNKKDQDQEGMSPRGLIHSPLLCNLIVDDLLKFSESAREVAGFLQEFADDFASLAEGSDTWLIRQRTQKYNNKQQTNKIEKLCDTKTH